MHPLPVQQPESPRQDARHWLQVSPVLVLHEEYCQFAHVPEPGPELVPELQV